MGWSRNEVRRHRGRRLHRLAPRRDAPARGARRARRRLPTPTTTSARARSGTLQGSTCSRRTSPTHARADPRRSGRRLPPRRPARRPRQLGRHVRALPAPQRARDAAALRDRRARRVRVVFASSSSVYGDAERYPTAEETRAAADLAVRDHEARLRAPRRAIRSARSGSTPSSSATSPSTARGSGRTWRSRAIARGARARRARSGSSATAAQARSFTYVGDAVAGDRSRRWSAAAGRGLQRRRRRRGDDERDDRARWRSSPAARSTSSASRRSRATSGGRRPTCRGAAAELGWEPETALRDGTARPSGNGPR